MLNKFNIIKTDRLKKVLLHILLVLTFSYPAFSRDKPPPTPTPCTEKRFEITKEVEVFIGCNGSKPEGRIVCKREGAQAVCKIEPEGASVGGYLYVCKKTKFIYACEYPFNDDPSWDFGGEHDFGMGKIKGSCNSDGENTASCSVRFCKNLNGQIVCQPDGDIAGQITFECEQCKINTGVEAGRGPTECKVDITKGPFKLGFTAGEDQDVECTLKYNYEIKF